jgi:hypothetical protein
MHQKFAVRTMRFVSLIIIIMAISGSIYAQKAVLEGKDRMVFFDEGLSPVAEKISGIYPVLKAEVEKAIGWRIDSNPRIFLIKDSQTFQKMSGSSIVAAYALPDKAVIVIDYSRMMSAPFTLEATIKHELCHILLHEKIASKRLPRWLDEGVAQWVSGGLADIVMGKRSLLSEAVRQNRLIGLKFLSDGFPNNDSMLMLAYEESKSVIEYIVQEKKTQGILDLLNLLKDGDDIDSAVMRTFSVSFFELEKSWHKDMAKSTLWISTLINNLYEILFSLAALALIYGFFRAWRRKGKYKDEDEGTAGE